MTTPPSPDEMLGMARDCFGISDDLISDDLMNRLALALALADAYQRGREDAAVLVQNLKQALNENGWCNEPIMAACDETIAAIRSAP